MCFFSLFLTELLCLPTFESLLLGRKQWMPIINCALTCFDLGQLLAQCGTTAQAIRSFLAAAAGRQAARARRNQAASPRAARQHVARGHFFITFKAARLIRHAGFLFYP